MNTTLYKIPVVLGLLCVCLLFGTCIDTADTNDTDNTNNMCDSTDAEECVIDNDNDNNGDTSDNDGDTSDNDNTGETDRDGARATYRITFNANWTQENNGRALPGGAHLTAMHGTTHNDAYTMWQTGALASRGVERVAETGIGDTLQDEIAARRNAGMADALIIVNGLGAVGSSSTTFTASRTHPLLSTISMVAPTSDWFVGVSSYSLLDSEDQWIDSATIDLRVYDAGTEQETILFSLGNDPEDPHQNISRVMGDADRGFQKDMNQDIIGTLVLEIQ